MFEFFKNCHSLQDVKKCYRDLCFKYHPDITHDNGEMMKKINVEYEKAFKHFRDKQTEETNETKANNETETTETPEEFRSIINSLVGMEGVNIDIVGCFIWLTGNTYSYKDKLKLIGFKWANKKKAWYWHTEEYVAGKHKSKSLDEIKARYGCQRVQAQRQICFNA